MLYQSLMGDNEKSKPNVEQKPDEKKERIGRAYSPPSIAKLKSESGKGQRYYLYDNELKRPTENPVEFIPRVRPPRPRLPFHLQTSSIYPTREEERFQQQLLQKREREHRIYSRPPDIIHASNTERIRLRSDRSERYEEEDYYSYDDKRRRYHGYDSRSSHSPSMRYWDKHERERFYDRSRRYDQCRSEYTRESDCRSRSRDSLSSRSRRTESYGRGRERRRSKSSELKPQPEAKEKESDEFDLNVELHPLMHFIDDKSKLLQEAMSILKGKKLEAMTPPVFSSLPPWELMERCREELETLNIATIANVIDGKLINSDLNNSQLKSHKSKGVSLKKIRKKLKEVLAEDGESLPAKKKKRKLDEGNKKVKKDKKHKKKKKKAKEKDLPAGPGLPPQKTLMELLELEYRAKAIKALLKNQDINSSQVDEILADSSPTDLQQSSVPGVLFENPDFSHVPVHSCAPKSDDSKDDHAPICPPVISDLKETEPLNTSSPVEVPANSESDLKSEGDEIVALNAPTEQICDIATGNNENFNGDDEMNEDSLTIHISDEEPLEEGECEEEDGQNLEPDSEIELEVYSESHEHLTAASQNKFNVEEGENKLSSKPESEIDAQVQEIENLSEEEEFRASYIRQMPDMTMLDKKESESPPPPPLSKAFRPEESALSRISAEDISSDESSGLEVEFDDGIIIGGNPADLDSKSENEEPLPPPVSTCDQKPEDYEEEPHNSKSQEEEDDEDLNPRTWFNRWYNSKKVQKGVKSSRMIGKLRSKLRREKVIEPPPPEPTEEAVPIIESFTAYQSIFGSGKYKSPTEDAEESLEQVVESQKLSEEEEEDESLWGDILG